MVEEFKDIKDYEGIYQVSDIGNVKSLKNKGTRKEKALKAGVDKGGYLRVVLSKDGVKKTYRVHRLVALTFLPNVDNKKTVNHKNGVKTDNSVGNLEWNTYSENNKHAFKAGLRNSSHYRGEKSPSSKLTEREVLQIRDLYQTKRFTREEIGSFYGCTKRNISSITSGKTWSHILKTKTL